MAFTYYIQSWNPNSTYPSNPQEGDICYTITLDQTWTPVAGVKKDNIVKEEIYQNGSWVEQGGGGGSDLTICSGTFVNNSNTPYSLYLCHADNIQNGSVGDSQSLPSVTRTFDVILFKGVAIGSVIMGPETAEVQGDAEYSDGDLFVTGDFTITFS